MPTRDDSIHWRRKIPALSLCRLRHHLKYQAGMALLMDCEARPDNSRRQWQVIRQQQQPARFSANEFGKGCRTDRLSECTVTFQTRAARRAKRPPEVVHYQRATSRSQQAITHLRGPRMRQWFYARLCGCVTPCVPCSPGYDLIPKLS